MIDVKNIKVFNFDGALRGLRNPMESWDRSDSYFGEQANAIYDVAYEWITREQVDRAEAIDYLSKEGESDMLDQYSFIGPKDMDLAQRMVLAGPDEGKFMRQIFVSIDITAPIYYWKEMSTYKVATVANSTSTMHKLAQTPITKDCFSFDPELMKLVVSNGVGADGENELVLEGAIDNLLYTLEHLRVRYLQTKSKSYWRALVQLLPESWNQTRTWTANYQVLRNIYFQRRNHRLQEWRDFCKIIETLPYSKDLITIEKDK